MHSNIATLSYVFSHTKFIYKEPEPNPNQKPENGGKLNKQNKYLFGYRKKKFLF